MAAPEPVVAASSDPAPLPVRNRRTAAVLLVWIAILAAAAVVVAWVRN